VIILQLLFFLMHKKQIKSKLVIVDEIVERKIKQRERIKAILKNGYC
jgi:hypothetical protein